MKKKLLGTVLLAGLLGTLCAVPAVASEFSDGGQEISSQLFSAASQDDYAASVSGNENMVYNLNGITEHFFGFNVDNTGKKPFTLAIPDSKYLSFYSDTLQPGESAWIDAIIRNDLPIGEYQETILITDTTGNLNMQIPVSFKIVGQGGFHTDKQKLDFGVIYEGKAMPSPQSFRIIMDDGFSDDSFLAANGSVHWSNGNLGNNFTAKYNKNTHTMTVIPKSSIKPGIYKGTLSIHYFDYEIRAHQADVKIRLTVLPTAPKIIRTTINRNRIDIDLANIDGTFYECFLSKNKSPVYEKDIIKKASYQRYNHITFTNVPKGKYYIHVRRVLPEFTSNRYSPFAAPKSVTVSVSTPSQPSITDTKVSKRDLTISVSRSKSTTGYLVSLSKYVIPEDCSDNAAKKPYLASYTKQNLTAKSVTLKNLAPGTYYVSVQAYNKQNGQLVYSPWSKMKKVTVK